MSTENTQPTRHDEHVERNPITGEIEYRSWIDENGILNEEYPEMVLTEEQRARLDRFTGPLMEEETTYIRRRQEAQTKQRAARARKPKATTATPSAD